MYSGRRKQLGQFNTVLHRPSASFCDTRIESSAAVSTDRDLVSRSSSKTTIVLRHWQFSEMTADGLPFLGREVLVVGVPGRACGVASGLGKPSEKVRTDDMGDRQMLESMPKSDRDGIN